MNLPATTPATTLDRQTHSPAACAAIMFLHAATALHPGSGTALGVIDLPVEREPHTDWPLIPGTSLKGVLRDALRESLREKYPKRRDADRAPEVTEIFGPPTDTAADHAGALSLTDARILAFPVRSMKGVFAWITCTDVLTRFARDVRLTGIGSSPPPAASPGSDECFVARGSPLEIAGQSGLLLEEFDFTAKAPPPDADTFLKAVAGMAFADPTRRDDFLKRVVILHPDAFTHFVRHSTHVRARIALDYETKTASDGALFYEEYLPPETILYSLLLATPGRGSAATPASEVIRSVRRTVDSLPFLQIGAGQTVGCGICTVAFHPREEKP